MLVVLLATVGFDAIENEPSKVWLQWPKFQQENYYRYVRAAEAAPSTASTNNTDLITSI